MELVREHRRIGHVVGRGTIGTEPFVRVKWNDYEVSTVPEFAVKPCGDDGLACWVLQCLESLVGELDWLGIDDATGLIRDAATHYPSSTTT